MSFAVSVITPVYNAAAYLRLAVESALQIAEVHEVILVEDGSPDGSLAVCEALAQEHPDRVRLFRHPNGENLGAGPSLNLGIAAARAPFIAILGADDLYLPHRFAQDREILLADPTIDGVYSALGVHFHNEEGRKWWTETTRRPPTLATVQSDLPPEELFFHLSLMGRQGHFSLDALTVRRHVFEQLQFSSLRLAQDTLFIIQLSALFRLAPGSRLTPVSLRGVHGHNRIRDVAGRRAAIEPIFTELFAWMKKAPLTRRQRRAIAEAYLRRQHNWRGMQKALRQAPSLFFHPQHTKRILLRAFLRHDLSEPLFPAFFPAWRSKNK